MIWLIRHTERILKKNHIWLRSDRGKENPLDVPITKNGEEYAELSVLEMINNDKNFNKIKYIYCSPMTRCIQTSIILQETIKKLTNKLLPIRIEYGLKEIYSIDIKKNLIFKNGKIYIEPNYHNEITLDDKLKINELLLKFGSKKIDLKYTSFRKFNEMKFKEENDIIGANKVIKTLKNILSIDDNFILCSHSKTLKYLYTALTHKIASNEISCKIGKKNWASLMGFKINKKYKYDLIYGPSIKYWKDNLY